MTLLLLNPPTHTYTHPLHSCCDLTLHTLAASLLSPAAVKRPLHGGGSWQMCGVFWLSAGILVFLRPALKMTEMLLALRNLQVSLDTSWLSNPLKKNGTC